MKFIIQIAIATIILSCTGNAYILRNPVTGKVCDKDRNGLRNVSVRYDSTDIFSPQNITTNADGYFTLPKITIKKYSDFIRVSKNVNNNIFFRKEGFKDYKTDLSIYNLEKDKIRVGEIILR